MNLCNIIITVLFRNSRYIPYIRVWCSAPARGNDLVWESSSHPERRHRRLPLF